jgi:hypothetical protein
MRVIALTIAGLLVVATPCFAELEDDGLLSPVTEASINRGLAYLAKTQLDNGSWSAAYPVANTALPLMAFMVQGHFPERGRYGKHLTKALDYLIAINQKNNGYMASPKHGMYEHALATLALSEVWGETQRDDVRDALIKAVRVIIKAQHASGGWRYTNLPADQDVSVTVMQVVALASAREAGVYVPQSVIDRARSYVIKCQNEQDGGFRYQLGQRSGSEFARSAAGVMALMMTNRRDSPEAQRGLRYLRQHGPANFRNGKYYYYAHYYAVQCFYQAGQRQYQSWYPRIRDEMIRRQDQSGRWSGGRAGDPYSTSMAILVLGVPYRYLPIYQR